MAKISRAGARHAQAWIDFFYDVGYATKDAVEAFIAYHKKNKHFQQTLARFIERGMVEEKLKGFEVTPKGTLHFLRKRRSVPLSKRKKWDGKWRLVSFDVSVRDNAKRALLRRLLKEFGFYQLHKSVWVCPHHLARDFWKLVVHYDLAQYCKVMLVEVLEGDEELKKHFTLN